MATLLLAGPSLFAAACGGGNAAKGTPTEGATNTAAIQTPGPTGTPVTKAGGGGTLHYANDEAGFAFDYPGDWQQPNVPITRQAEMGTENLIVQVALTNDTEDIAIMDGVMVEAARLGVDVPPDRLREALLSYDALMAQLAGQMGGAVTDNGWTELGGLTARRYSVTFTMNGQPVMSEFLYTISGDKQIDVNCQAKSAHFENIRAGCQVVYDSFNFISSANS